ncbi:MULTISPECIES: SHOCT domain-containing protein [unclassified Enterococcus]|uniref:SHOCT domain-containing protein n=1 Tax=unclassified Enterococcus TaxID=2608891 RepID=UPI0015547D77|nr:MULTISPECIES: SHOCT domain-containing protein [unclassified Enterococcus]MBS7577231.1 SHOCT domain-containing protein [Enterococcus sp. MMGLQ5-2]MBS7584676.1 SHOCT domain-containing protein [Enterococcus sp. MMGLQ5-1]NPD12531.1 SHOCT domain-containing protein [Enterococcus sp. MMGLQ5-1]NPD37065.1 SHOCT domain-containing protein [Enterococcus sp. MMGLQ5-2]
MQTAEEMYYYARRHKLGFNWTPLIGGWLQKRHFKLIEESLLDKERVLVSFIGRHRAWDSQRKGEYGNTTQSFENEKIRYRDTQGFYAYAITTEQRLIYAHWRPLHHDATNIPLSNINNVNPETYLIFGSVKIETFGDYFSVFWTKNVIRKITKMIQQGISDSKDGIMDGRGASDQPLNKSIRKDVRYDTRALYQSLREAKQALDEGLITEAEYETYKQKLLS